MLGAGVRDVAVEAKSPTQQSAAGKRLQVVTDIATNKRGMRTRRLFARIVPSIETFARY